MSIIWMVSISEAHQIVLCVMTSNHSSLYHAEYNTWILCCIYWVIYYHVACRLYMIKIVKHLSVMNYSHANIEWQLRRHLYDNGIVLSKQASWVDVLKQWLHVFPQMSVNWGRLFVILWSDISHTSYYQYIFTICTYKQIVIQVLFSSRLSYSSILAT